MRECGHSKLQLERRLGRCWSVPGAIQWNGIGELQRKRLRAYVQRIDADSLQHGVCQHWNRCQQLRRLRTLVRPRVQVRRRIVRAGPTLWSNPGLPHQR